MCPLTVDYSWGYTMPCKKHYSYSWTDRYGCQNRTLEVEQMGDRVILHSDINCCYASIEHLHHPELAGKPLAVGGDPEARHGIVLTADYIAKKYGVKTGMALWQAKQVCPDITFVSPRMDLYLRFSRMAHEIYAEYTDRQEPYGIDECWLDVTGSSSLKGDGLLIAQEISRRMKSELGITVSVGVSFNKIFAKLGSDYKKPDAITTMYKSEFKQKAWSLLGRLRKNNITQYNMKIKQAILHSSSIFNRINFKKGRK